MAQGLIENPVFRSVARSWRGPFPWTLAELVAGLSSGGVVTAICGLAPGVILFVLVVSALIGWRRLDHDRSDYAIAYLRQRVQTHRSYNPNEADEAFVCFPEE